jgi:hypothetical protein
VALTTLSPVTAAPPIVAVAPATKFVPVIVMLVPAANGPLVGAIAVAVGAAT